MLKSKAKRILLCSGVRGDTRRYRLLHLHEQLCALGLESNLKSMVDLDLELAFRQSWDMVILHRVAYDAYFKKLITLVQRSGAMIIFDCDDLIFDLDAFQYISYADFADPIRSKLYRSNIVNNRNTLLASGGVTTSTDFLAEQVRALGKPAWVHRNGFSMEMLDCAERAYQERQLHPGRVVIGYASGTPTHNLDFDLVKPALKQVLALFPQAELWLVGPLDAGDDWGELVNRLHHFGLVPWRKLPEMLVQFDINLAPLLTGNPFSQSKSEIKYMEAGMVRVPTVASDTEAFCHAIRSGENGFLVGKDQDWFTPLSQLVADASLRARMGERAYAEVVAHYHPLVRAAELAQTLDAISLQISGKPFWKNPPSQEELKQRTEEFALKKFKIPARQAKEITNFRLGIYSLLHKGPRLLLKQMWVIFRRSIAPIFPFDKQTK
jgi:glycosyltransferase involved in cell wall biosynthesis